MRHLISLTLIMLGVSNAANALEIVIDGGVEQAVPIAVIDFAGATGRDNPADTIRNDLRRSGYFQILENADLPANPGSIEEVDFADWQRIGVENLLIGDVMPTTDGYKFRYYLLDVFRQGQIISERVQSENLRLAAHRISDSVVAALSGHQSGMFLARMVFVSTNGLGDNASYFLNVSDYDGYDARILLDSPEPILSPTFSPDGGSLSYVAFEKNGTTIYVQDIATGRRQRVSAWPGINGAPAYSPDGGSLAASLSRDGDPEIYVLQLATGTWQRLSNSPSIDTEPVWLPDGKSLLFTSDRSGKPQIYQVTLETGATRRLTFNGDYNANAAVSADGRTMATVTASGNRFKLAVFDLSNGQHIRDIDTVASPEEVDFSANGQLLLYSSGDRLGTVPISGSPDIPLSIPGALEPRQASWGRRLNR